jgi:hypothetical protein
LKVLQKITPSFLKGCKIFSRECEGQDPKIRVIALHFYSLMGILEMIVLGFSMQGEDVFERIDDNCHEMTL